MPPLRLLLATGNAHKAEEFARLFAEAGLSAEVMTATRHPRRTISSATSAQC